MKACTRCGHVKSMDEFYVRRLSSDGRASICAECSRKYMRQHRSRNPDSNWETQLKHKFGITREDYENLNRKQGRACRICGTANTSPRGRFCVDHCHATGSVRGLLCNKCNAGLGQFDNDPRRMRAAADYLEESQ